MSPASETPPSDHSAAPRPVVLLILDGWGHREAAEHNAIAAARTPVWDRLWTRFPHTLIDASQGAVGLPDRQMGNSEVGHLNIGAGRVVLQEYTRINRAIESGAFFHNPALAGAIDLAKGSGRAVHILGLLSPGGVHSHENQIHALAKMAVTRGAPKIYLHAFLDGRDTPPRSAAASIQRMSARFEALGHGRIASVVGRYYAMDRDHRWPRIQAAFELIAEGRGAHRAATADEALAAAYARGESDEFVAATAIVPAGQAPVQVADGDVLIMMNFRSDRARQITRAFIEPDFDGFVRRRTPRLGQFLSLTQYQSGFNIPVAFAPEHIANVLGAWLADHGMRQLRVAETEKYAHVTFFMNGGVETPFAGEQRILVPSPTDVATYNLKPEMSVGQVADHIVAAIRGGEYDAIVCNFANPDMVGHTGDFAATVRAIEAVDASIGRVVEALREAGGEILITADHGNAEQLYDPHSGQPHTAHTTNPVPLLYIGRPAHLKAGGALEDIAPTLLAIMGLEIPAEMTGKPLLTQRGDATAFRRHSA